MVCFLATDIFNLIYSVNIITLVVVLLVLICFKDSHMLKLLLNMFLALKTIKKSILLRNLKKLPAVRLFLIRHCEFCRTWRGSLQRIELGLAQLVCNRWAKNALSSTCLCVYCACCRSDLCLFMLSIHMIPTALLARLWCVEMILKQISWLDFI